VPKSKGKVKARTINTHQQLEDDEGLVSEDELEYNEQNEESDDSGSEYEGSGDDLPRHSKLRGREDVDVVSDSEEDEALMITAAIEASHKTASLEAQQRTGAGPSTRVTRSISATTPGASRVTERRSEACVTDSDDEFNMDSVELQDESGLSVLETSDEEPMAPSSSKGKGKAKAKQKGKHKTTKEMSRLERARQRGLAQAERKEAKKEERKLSLQLGRRLTYVSPAFLVQRDELIAWLQAEKSSLALRIHHPELKDVWGDLEAQVPITVPEQAKQPVGLKVTLLPFQRESLSWMRKQENGVWHGGLLAVSVKPRRLPRCSNNSCRMRWGERARLLPSTFQTFNYLLAWERQSR
jgi:DNA repair protein RAD16